VGFPKSSEAPSFSSFIASSISSNPVQLDAWLSQHESGGNNIVKAILYDLNNTVRGLLDSKKEEGEAEDETGSPLSVMTSTMPVKIVAVFPTRAMYNMETRDSVVVANVIWRLNQMKAGGLIEEWEVNRSSLEEVFLVIVERWSTKPH